MKKILLLLITLCFLSCNDDDNNVMFLMPVDQLPPPTQNGANTFGCLIDGKVFKPGVSNNSYNCFYQIVDGDYYFYVTANSRSNNNVLTAISIGTEKLSISENQVLNLYDRIDGNCFGNYYIGNSSNGVIENYYTSSDNTGELKITKLDFEHNIVSGTFWFNIEDNRGIVHNITEGRFDMQFTQ